MGQGHSLHCVIYVIQCFTYDLHWVAFEVGIACEAYTAPACILQVERHSQRPSYEVEEAIIEVSTMFMWKILNVPDWDIDRSTHTSLGKARREQLGQPV